MQVKNKDFSHMAQLNLKKVNFRHSLFSWMHQHHYLAKDIVRTVSKPTPHLYLPSHFRNHVMAPTCININHNHPHPYAPPYPYLLSYTSHPSPSILIIPNSFQMIVDIGNVDTSIKKPTLLPAFPPIFQLVRD